METHAPLFKKSRNEEAFRQAAIEVQALSDQAASGQIELAYLDEAATGELAAAAGLTILDHFLSDGREGDLNLYTIMAG